MNELVKGRKMSSISLIKVARAFVNPKGITNHSKSPSLNLKVIFHTFMGSWNLVITRLHINLDEILGPLELVQQVINPWDWIPVPDIDFV